jgi:hypothetical protein
MAWTWTAAGSGKATADGDALAQFGSVAIDARVHDATSGWPPTLPSAAPVPAASTASDISEGGLAELPLMTASPTAPIDPASALLSRLSLVVDAVTTPTADLRLRCLLRWSGPVDDALVQAAHDRWPAFEWHVLLAWQALGTQR